MPESPVIEPAAVEGYLRTHVAAEAHLLALTPFGADDELHLKAHGYGRPLRVSWLASDGRHDAVLHTMSSEQHGHDRRADRLAALVEAGADMRRIPRHVRPLDLGTFDGAGQLVPLPPGEPWLLTEYVAGEPYAVDLAALAPADRASPEAVARVAALADYLAMLHLQPAAPADHLRHVRDTVGGGEGIFGIVDGWPLDHPVAPPARLRRIEELAVGWRWRLRAHGQRARRIHGDFHPFNILFRAGTDFSVLDASRRVAGDAADDVTCLALNYLFFALGARPRFDGACHELWQVFWDRYLVASGDWGLLEVVAPWFAWRALVLASPLWYPRSSDSLRERLLSFAEELLGGAAFDPFALEESI